MGISAYQHADGEQLRNLRYAKPDAEAVAKILQLPSCGDVDAKTRMKVLLDEQATREAIVGGLRDFLRGPAAGDLVILYFACHGVPDPDPRRSSIVYLVAHDTDVDQIARTGVLMREILDSAADFLGEKRRVLLIADTCYSGSLLRMTTAARGADDEAERAAIVSRFFEGVGRSRLGTSVLASAGARQSAQEGDRWSGHGVFTHYLLKGLRGEADRHPIDHQVTVDELFSYVKDNVERDTAGAQRPVMSVADPDLIVAYTAGLAAEDHMAVGKALVRMAALLDDEGRYEAADRELEAALRAAAELGQHPPEAALQRGLVKLMAGKPQAAIKVLDDAVARDEAGTWPQLRYYLGLAQILAGDREAATMALARFGELAGGDERALWAAGLAGQLAASTPRHQALLIGVQNNRHHPKLALRGPENDLRLMRSVLVEHCGFADVNVQTLYDEQATRPSALTALAELATAAVAEGVVVVYFSGHSALGIQEDYWIMNDTRIPTGEVEDLYPSAEGTRTAAITCHELNEALVQISASRCQLLVILDTHPNDVFIELASKSSYVVLLAAAPDQQTYEHPFDEQGKTMFAGLLTYAMVQRIRSDGPHVRCADFVAALTEDIHTRRANQTPYLVGAGRSPLFPVPPDTNTRRWVDFSLRRAYQAFDSAGIEDLYESARATFGDTVPSDLHASVGRGFLELGEPARALEALERASAGARTLDPDLLAPLAFARITARQFDRAAGAVRQLAETVEVPADLEPLVERLRATAGRALVVGIEQYQGPGDETPAAPHAVRDARAVHDLLVHDAHFQVCLLLNEAASRQTIIDEFTTLCEAAANGPAVFYFAGNGSVQRASEQPTLLSSDGRTGNVFDVGLDELARIAGPAQHNLVCLLDADFSPTSARGPGIERRFVPPDLRSTQASRDVGGRGLKALQPVVPVIGSATGFVDAATETIRFVGNAARALGCALPARVEHGTSDWLASRLAASPGDAAPFVAELARDRLTEDQLATVLRRAERAPFARAAVLLGRQIERSENQDPDRRVSRAVAYGLLGDTQRALDDLDVAIRLLRDAGRSCFEARYHYGRLLVENQQDPGRAISELELAVQEQPDHAGARYFLGTAIRQLIEQQWLARVGEHWRRYVELGAPLGHRAEVSSFLRTRRQK